MCCVVFRDSSENEDVFNVTLIMGHFAFGVINAVVWMINFSFPSNKQQILETERRSSLLLWMRPQIIILLVLEVLVFHHAVIKF